ncbi:MAG: type II 3-dehydroquinate dehydratase [Parvularculaceae bacterium]|nr:type II 3-dehydroquinate dehydratase [Parvularculaceae bacterium]
MTDAAPTPNAPVLFLNGPNLNLLGTREPEIYGRRTLADLEAATVRHGAAIGLAVDFRQSNHEGVLIDWIHAAIGVSAGLVINPGAYGHTSIPLHDALKAFTRPKIEVHLSNVAARESFRQVSYVSPAVTGTVAGFGADGYLLALDAMRRLIDNA